MESISPKTRTELWIRLYLGTNQKEKLFNSCLEKAYLNMNRTIRGLGGFKNSAEYEALKNWLGNQIKDLIIEHSIKNQAAFDKIHVELCDVLVVKFRTANSNKVPLTIGQAQKWINMSLKYMLALGNEKIPGIESNAHLFHIPIDSIIQEWLNTKYGVKPLHGPWSKVESYEDYLGYQKTVREQAQAENTSPIALEFQLFNLS